MQALALGILFVLCQFMALVQAQRREGAIESATEANACTDCSNPKLDCTGADRFKISCIVETMKLGLFAESEYDRKKGQVPKEVPKKSESSQAQYVSDQDKLSDIAMKDPRELEEFFHSNRVCSKPDLHDGYVRYHSHFLKVAGETFGYPIAALSCSVFQENKFDSKSSPAGALGPAQIMPGNLIFINKILSIGRSEKSKKDLAHYQKNVVRMKAKMGGEEDLKKLSANEREEYKTASDFLNNFDLASRWRNCYAKSTATPVYAKYSETLSKSYLRDLRRREIDKLERVVLTAADLKNNYPISFCTSALWKSADGRRILGPHFKIDNATSANQFVNFYTAINGVYNMGNGNALKVLSYNARLPKDPKVWVKRLTFIPETKTHMAITKTCMAKNTNGTYGRHGDLNSKAVQLRKEADCDAAERSARKKKGLEPDPRPYKSQFKQIKKSKKDRP
jgi:hypothetical protein